VAHVDDRDAGLVAQPLDVRQDLVLPGGVQGGQGLSISRSRGLASKARPRATRCFSPPDRPPGRRSRKTEPEEVDHRIELLAALGAGVNHHP
jgi:hypothetical protein